MAAKKRSSSRVRTPGSRAGADRGRARRRPPRWPHRARACRHLIRRAERRPPISACRNADRPRGHSTDWRPHDFGRVHDRHLEPTGRFAIRVAPTRRGGTGIRHRSAFPDSAFPRRAALLVPAAQHHWLVRGHTSYSLHLLLDNPCSAGRSTSGAGGPTMPRRSSSSPTATPRGRPRRRIVALVTPGPARAGRARGRRRAGPARTG